jgi:hypothetical protein
MNNKLSHRRRRRIRVCEKRDGEREFVLEWKNGEREEGCEKQCDEERVPFLWNLKERIQNQQDEFLLDFNTAFPYGLVGIISTTWIIIRLE